MQHFFTLTPSRGNITASFQRAKCIQKCNYFGIERIDGKVTFHCPPKWNQIKCLNNTLGPRHEGVIFQDSRFLIRFDINASYKNRSFIYAHNSLRHFLNLSTKAPFWRLNLLKIKSVVTWEEDQPPKIWHRSPPMELSDEYLPRGHQHFCLSRVQKWDKILAMLDLNYGSKKSKYFQVFFSGWQSDSVSLGSSKQRWKSTCNYWWSSSPTKNWAKNLTSNHSL